jgi:hypothetical protein
LSRKGPGSFRERHAGRLSQFVAESFSLQFVKSAEEQIFVPPIVEGLRSITVQRRATLAVSVKANDRTGAGSFARSAVKWLRA